METAACDLLDWEAHVGHNTLWHSGVRHRMGIVRNTEQSKMSVLTKSEVVSRKVYDKIRKCNAAGLCLHKSPIPRKCAAIHGRGRALAV